MFNSQWHNCSTVTGTIVQQTLDDSSTVAGTVFQRWLAQLFNSHLHNSSTVKLMSFCVFQQNSSTVTLTDKESCHIPGRWHSIHLTNTSSNISFCFWFYRRKIDSMWFSKFQVIYRLDTLIRTNEFAGNYIIWRCFFISPEKWFISVESSKFLKLLKTTEIQIVVFPTTQKGFPQFCRLQQIHIFFRIKTHFLVISHIDPSNHWNVTWFSSDFSILIPDHHQFLFGNCLYHCINGVSRALSNIHDN